MPLKAENRQVSSHEQYLLERHFLDICQCAFKFKVKYFMLLITEVGI